MPKFRSKEVVDAIQWTGDVAVVLAFYAEAKGEYPKGVKIAHSDGRPLILSVFGYEHEARAAGILVREEIARKGDWVVRKVGEPGLNLLVYGNAVFSATYGLVVR